MMSQQQYPTSTETLVFEKQYVDVRNGKTKNTFVTEDKRRFETWDATMAARVAAGMNNPQAVTYETRQNGQYTNLVIQETSVAHGSNGGQPAQAPEPSSSGGRRGGPEERTSIHRQVAGKLTVEAFNNVGIDVVAHQNEALEYAQTWVDFFESGYASAAPAEEEE